MKAKIQTTIKEQGKSYQDTLRTIEDEILATYGCLLPSGEVTITLVLLWTKAGFLGELKRQGKILAWKLVCRPTDNHRFTSSMPPSASLSSVSVAPLRFPPLPRI